MPGESRPKVKMTKPNAEHININPTLSAQQRYSQSVDLVFLFIVPLITSVWGGEQNMLPCGEYVSNMSPVCSSWMVGHMLHLWVSGPLQVHQACVNAFVVCDKLPNSSVSRSLE